MLCPICGGAGTVEWVATETGYGGPDEYGDPIPVPEAVQYQSPCPECKGNGHISGDGLMTHTELKMAAEMMRLASEEFGHHGCGDHWLKDTPEHREFLQAVRDHDEDATPVKPCRNNGKMELGGYLPSIMEYLTKKLEDEANRVAILELAGK